MRFSYRHPTQRLLDTPPELMAGSPHCPVTFILYPTHP